VLDPHGSRQARREAHRRAIRRRRQVLAGVVSLVVAAVVIGVLIRPGHRSGHAKDVAAAVTTTTSTTTHTTTHHHKHHHHTTTSTTATTTTSTTQQTTTHKHRHHVRHASCGLNVAAAGVAAQSELSSGYRVGFALVNARGGTLAAVHANTPNFGASITKSMLLVAYLQDFASEGISPEANEELTAMIEVSDNTAADWVFDHLTSPAADVQRVASNAGMTGFQIDQSDPVYVLGQSLITARDFAHFFAVIQRFMPARYRSFGMGLLANVEQRVGLLAAGLPGLLYSKEGWKPEDSGELGAPYVVNQAAQFSCAGTTFGIAVTVGGASDETTAEAVVQHIASALAG
jgi:hypothetical protein